MFLLAIFISEQKKELTSYKLGMTELVVYVDDASQFKIGEKYKFLIKVLDAKNFAQITNNLQLIYYEKAIP